MQTTCVGIAENSENYFTLSPNPVADYLTLKAGKEIREGINITINDVYGKVIKDFTFYESKDEVRIDVRFLSSGIYVLNIKAGDNLVIEKFVKK